MHAILMDHASNHGQDIALVSEDIGVSYQTLYQRVEVLRSYLTDKGVSVLAIQLENGIDWVIADLACVLAGITCVPIPPFFSETQRQHVLRTAGVDAVVKQSDTGFPSPGLEQASLDFIAEPSASKEAVKITFTSGSTGDPKGVVLAHDDLVKIASSVRAAMSCVDINRHLCMLPLATLLENVAGLYAPLIKGVTILLPPPSETGLQGSSGLDIESFASCLAAHKPDSLILVPQLLMALATLTGLDMVQPDYLQMVAVGGGRISTSLLGQCADLNIPVFEGYGLSEAGSVVTLNLPGANRPGTVGKVLPHARIRRNSEGELEVSGVLMKGYAGGEEHCSEWLATGDLGFIDDDGFVTITGRKKNIFITAFGRNVNPEWVEAELMQQATIAHALFIGEAREKNIALIWPRFETSREAISEIVDSVNADLPDYACIHDFVLMNEPLDPALVTSNGRLKRHAVIAAHREMLSAETVNT